MHPVGTSFLAGAMVGYGYNAVPLPDEDQVTLDIGKAHTRGSECLPAAATTGAILRALREHKAAPDEHALFMPTASGPCRFGQYCLMQRMVFNRIGLEDVPFMTPSAENAYQGLSQRLRFQAWNSILSADILWKCRCKLLPYEKNPGEVKRVLAACMSEMTRCLEKKGNVGRALAECIHRFMEVPVEKPGSKPLVGIVGEIYVRCNPFCNDYLTDTIERMGGEAWLAPLSEWMSYTAEMQAWMAGKRVFNLREKLDASAKNHFMHTREHHYYQIAKPLLHDRIEPTVKEVIKIGRAACGERV
jgi:predicted nucleotide-binding protein (sugar kinase/HSP70/actin superfamily)